jgi:hypothetical protein
MNFFSVEDTFQYIDDIPDGNLLEFGVYRGSTLSRLIQRRLFVQVWAFDSFEGLPDNQEGNPDWPAGAFNAVEDLSLHTPERLMEYITKLTARPDINFVKGFFDQTLTSGLGERLSGTGSYIHLDCDLYSSTKTVLDWLFKHNVPKPGCLFRYDDWYGYSNKGGQQAAHEIFSKKYHVNFQGVADNVFIYEGS